MSLAIAESLRQRFQRTLSEDELERVARLRLEDHKKRFVASRGWQRSLLAAYLGCRPEEIVFAYAELGKPRLATPRTQDGLEFNLSNSHEMALLAVTRKHDVGVDVEYVGRRSDTEAIARRFFADREQAALERVPEAARRAAFFRCWTRKEAILKAAGVGLTFPLNRVEVTLAEDQPARLLKLDASLGDLAGWRLYHLSPAEEYLGALAIRGHVQQVDTFAQEI
jgi:4'-phosphopantetheinyl transferase